MERTLSIVKPDGVSRGLIGEVVKRLEANELKIAAMKMIHMTRKQAEGFYAVHRERPFFGSLTDFMTSGPAVVMVLEGENAIARYRELMGATNPPVSVLDPTIARQVAAMLETVTGPEGTGKQARVSNYLVSISGDRDRVYLACLELSTGEFRLSAARAISVARPSAPIESTKTCWYQAFW